jgi:hypothetical protein
MNELSTLRHGGLSRGRRVSTSAWVFAALLAGAACRRLAITHYGIIAIEGLVVVPHLFVIAQRPLVVVVVLLALGSSAFSYAFLSRVSFTGHPPINLGDVCLAAAVGGTLWRRPWQTWPAAIRRYSWALGTFRMISGVATIKTPLLGSVGARGAAYEYRNWLCLAASLRATRETAQARVARTSGDAERIWLSSKRRLVSRGVHAKGV